MNPQTIFICSSCDAQFPKWQGRCTECGSWGTIQEIANRKSQIAKSSSPPAQTLPLNSIAAENVKRIQTGIEEFDRVLGGGIVPSSLVLIGGEPGIGKSTLILQVAGKIPGKVLYISGEESGSQIKMRIDRLGLRDNAIQFLGETHLETICATITETKPALAIIDSIQTIYSEDVPSEPGSVAQVRTSTVKLLEISKKTNTAIFIIGHITKEGVVAGPKTLEHLVDTVIYLEGERYHQFRLLRTIKNRFGSTSELGVFEMTNTGMKEVKNPSAIFLMERTSPVSGSIVTAALEGSRIFFAEVQALSSRANFGYPQRKSLGFDTNRLSMLAAVLEKRAGIHLENNDIHLNIAGGLKITEPAVDLAVCLAIVSAYKNIIIDSATIAFGEVGLGGEIRQVGQIEKRVQEAEKLGFKKIIMPRGASARTKCEAIQAGTVLEAIEKINNFKIQNSNLPAGR